MQGIECDLLETTKECNVMELLRAERLDESVWDELYESANIYLNYNHDNKHFPIASCHMKYEVILYTRFIYLVE